MWKIIVIIFVLLIVVWFLKFDKHYPKIGEIRNDNNFWGVTFSTKITDQLFLPEDKLYQEILDDLQVRQIRLPIYWDEIEKAPNEFDFSRYDNLLTEGAKRNVQFLINIGWRLPRWPECHTPTWLASSETAKVQKEILHMLEVVVEHYKNRPEIIAWQVENEPLLDTFGVCPPSDKEFLQKEITLVKSLDSRLVVLTVSGELSSWSKEAKLADKIGTSVYRVVWNRYFGYWHWFLPSWYYNFKANFLKVSNRIVVSELQAEPWSPNGSLLNFPSEEFNKSFNLQQFRANIQFAQNIGFSPNYLWGAEWWYLQKQLGNSIYWDFAKKLFRN